jgi:small basic protein (TIGR04137 family)
MSIDKSLRRKGSMTRTRCVLKRSERILKMMENGAFADDRSPFGLPKTRVQKIAIKKKAKAEKAEDAAAAPAAGAKGSKK